MFTGIVEAMGSVAALDRGQTGARLALDAGLVAKGVAIGDSVAVNGCCLTVTAIDGKTLGFDVLAETLRLTNLGTLVPGSRVNLERAVAVGERMGGHFVQGHIDCTAEILAITKVDLDHRVEIAIPAASAKYVAYKGSLAVNGISLTVAEIHDDRAVLWIIPHTMAATNLGRASVGDLVNLEFDMLAKYVERLLDRPA